MDNFINFLQTQWPYIVELIVGLLVVLGLIARWTPTPKDDAWVAKILGWVNMLPQTAKAQLDETKKK